MVFVGGFLGVLVEMFEDVFVWVVDLKDVEF